MVSCDEEDEGTVDGVAMGTAGMGPDEGTGAGGAAEAGG